MRHCQPPPGADTTQESTAHISSISVSDRHSATGQENIVRAQGRIIGGKALPASSDRNICSALGAKRATCAWRADWCEFWEENGGPERIRTFDLRLRRATLYPAELRVPLDRFIAIFTRARQSQILRRAYSRIRLLEDAMDKTGLVGERFMPHPQIGPSWPGSPAIHAAAALSPPEGRRWSGVRIQEAISVVALRPLRSRSSR